MSLPAFGYTQEERVCDKCIQKHQPEKVVGHVGSGFVVLNPDVM